MNIDGKTLVLFFLSPPLVAGPQKPQKLTNSKIKYEDLGPKNVIHTLGPGWQMMDPFGLWST